MPWLCWAALGWTSPASAPVGLDVVRVRLQHPLGKVREQRLLGGLPRLQEGAACGQQHVSGAGGRQICAHKGAKRTATLRTGRQGRICFCHLPAVRAAHLAAPHPWLPPATPGTAVPPHGTAAETGGQANRGLRVRCRPCLLASVTPAWPEHGASALAAASHAPARPEACNPHIQLLRV